MENVLAKQEHHDLFYDGYPIAIPKSAREARIMNTEEY